MYKELKTLESLYNYIAKYSLAITDRIADIKARKNEKDYKIVNSLAAKRRQWEDAQTEIRKDIHRNRDTYNFWIEKLQEDNDFIEFLRKSFGE